MSKHAAVTIVSKNYFAYAKTLAESYKKHHPENDFIIVLVDRADGYVPASLPCGAEIVELGDVAIPDVSRFIYRYSIMELNTAVKPFALADFFQRRNYETLLYIDPDILVFRPLSAIYEALESASIVLTPHMRKPYYDDAMPSDVSILQSGTYNLGFVGLKRTKSATELLDWWMTKLYRDCIVDIPNGLFVDQKWMDLVPGFFPDHRIIYGPGYNAAYWNLHERTLALNGETWEVDGDPLSFFHFSGYIPFAPQSLSKHQNRHQLENLPTLKMLTDGYATALFQAGYEESSNWPYAFETLSNGVPMPMSIVRNIMQWAARTNIPTPCPITDADDFCRFLMSRNLLPNHPNAVLLFDFLLQMRADVAAAYPAARHDHDDAAFRGWVSDSGIKEYRFEKLLAFETEQIEDHVADLFARLRKANRRDVFEKHVEMWHDTKAFEAFAGWITAHGIKQLKLTRKHAELLLACRPGVGRILNIYFLRGDLQVHFPVIWDNAQIGAFAAWLRQHRNELGLALDEISLFAEFAVSENKLIDKMRFLYTHKGLPDRATPSIYAIDSRRYEIGSVLSTAEVLSFLADESDISPADHYIEKYGADARQLDDFEKSAIPGLSPRKNFAYFQRLKEGFSEREAKRPLVNFAGFVYADSGMGESGRSMRATLAATKLSTAMLALPHPKAQVDVLPSKAEIFGWPVSGADISVAVANADSSGLLESFLPASFWGKKSVGYWVWETEELPAKYKKSELLFDEIWTPSTYSADAIARTVSIPVRVLPHTLDFASIEQAKPNRRKFGLPEKATLFGFMFDPLSVIERKNVGGLIKAFRQAFRPDDNCYLVLKVNGRTQGTYDYETIRAAAGGERILFVEATLSRSETFNFLKSLDVYVSLHRAEGFGLTCAEAMALGLPVIASEYSGNLEFMTRENSLLVPCSIMQTERPFGAYPCGTRWANPDIDGAVSHMRSMLGGSLRTELGGRGRVDVKTCLAPERIAESAGLLISRLLGRGA